METDYAAKEVERLSGAVTKHLDADPFVADAEGKFTMDVLDWERIREMARAGCIESSEPPEGVNKVTIEAPYLLVFIRLARCYLDGMQAAS